MRERREIRKHKRDAEIHDRNAIDPDTRFAQIELGRQEWLAFESLQKHAGYGYEVRGQDSTDTERRDGVKRYGAADVDHGQYDGDDESDEDGVERDVPAGLDLGEEGAEGDAVVAGEGEELAGRGRDVVHAAKNCHGDGDTGKCDGAGFGLRCIVHDLDVRLPRWRSEHAFYIADGEAEGDEDQEAEDAVGNGGPDHGSGKRFRGIAQLFTHMCCGVRANKREDGSKLSYETRQPDTAPARVVLERAKNLFGLSLWTEHPHCDENGEETEYVQHEDNAFDQREFAR